MQTESIRILHNGHIRFFPRVHGGVVLELRPDGFYYKGKVVEDEGIAHDCFVRFLRSHGCPVPSTPEESSGDN